MRYASTVATVAALCATGCAAATEPARSAPPSSATAGSATSAVRGAPTCTESALVRDLDIAPYVANARMFIGYCEDGWAVVSWDFPGDTQRMLRIENDRWVTYVSFPHRVCWDQAADEGVPANLRMYFTYC